MESISISDTNFTQDQPGRSVVDLRCLIDCTFDNVYIHNADIGMDVDGSGTTTLTDSEVHGDQLGIRASGTGQLVVESSTIVANETAISISSLDSEISQSTISLHNGVGPAAVLLEGEHQWNDVEIQNHTAASILNLWVLMHGIQQSNQLRLQPTALLTVLSSRNQR